MCLAGETVNPDTAWLDRAGAGGTGRCSGLCAAADTCSRDASPAAPSGAS